MNPQTETDTLFTERHPSAYGYAYHAEDQFGYMNLHADVPVLAAREMLEGWYSHYPAAHRLDLVRRFRSKNHKQHEGAFWELYLYELFRRMGFEVQVHPCLDDIETRPDFLLTKDSAALALVEARLAGLETDQMTSADRLKKELHDALDKVHSPNFFLRVEEIKPASTRPSFRILTNLVEKWLATLDPDLPIEAFLNKRNASSLFKWEYEGWHVSLGVLPKSPGHRGHKGGRSVGIFEGDFQWLDTKSELKKALSEKANKYGRLDLPFLIAINHMGPDCDRVDWTDALYGSQAEKILFDERGVLHQQPFRKNDGFWISRGTPRHTSVSAILAAWNVNIWSMGAHPVEVYQHFSADRSIDLSGNLPCWYLPDDKDELVMLPGRSSAEILGIPKGWPGEWKRD